MTNQKDDNMMKIKEGDKPFDFEYRDPKNNEFKLSNLLKHKKIVIYFYPKDFTPGCTIEAEEFTRDYALFEQQGIEIIGISPDSNDSHTKFREKMNIPYMLASDPTMKFQRNMGSTGSKNLWVRNTLELRGQHFWLIKVEELLKYIQVSNQGVIAKKCLNSLKRE